MPTLRLHAFAKINLGLRVLGRRSDGYHELRTAYQSISLADTLSLSMNARRAPGADTLQVETDDPSIPNGAANLAYRAAELWRSTRRWRGTIKIHIMKGIPSASGLGGASSDASATLSGLERLTGDRLPVATRLDLAAQLGSDVPFFQLGGRALGCGRGEEVYPLPDLPARRVLVVYPGYAQSTREAYAELSSRLTSGEDIRRIYSFGKWPLFPWQEWEAAENDFEGVVFAKWPELRRLKGQFLRAGAEMASLTGSGTAVYAIFDSARKLFSAQRQVSPKWRAFAVRTLSRAEFRRRFEF